MKINRISKEDFVEALQVIKKDLDYYNALYDIGKEYHRQDEINILPESICLAVSLLEKASGDVNEWVNWWVFEKEFGKRNDINVFDAGDHTDKVIPTDTAEQLYDLITDNLKKDEVDKVF